MSKTFLIRYSRFIEHIVDYIYVDDIIRIAIINFVLFFAKKIFDNKRNARV